MEIGSASLPPPVVEDGIYTALTYNQLNPSEIMNRVKSPKAGAVVLFAGTTRDNMSGEPVLSLYYDAYAPLALKSMASICRTIRERYKLTAMAMVHRLSAVPIGEESILIAVSSPHRHSAFEAGREALEECKQRVEIWKKEHLGGQDEALWRANIHPAKGIVREDSGS